MSEFIVSARNLVHGHSVFSGDWSPDPDSAFNECMCPSGYHLCQTASYQFLDLFGRYRVSREFEQNVLDRGVVHALSIETDYDDESVKILCNGHHRLQVAYKFNLYVPIVFSTRRDRWLADDDKSLPMSGDPDRYGEPASGVASFPMSQNHNTYV